MAFLVVEGSLLLAGDSTPESVWSSDLFSSARAFCRSSASEIRQRMNNNKTLLIIINGAFSAIA